MGGSSDSKEHGSEPAYLPSLPTRSQGTETLAVILGLPGSVLLAGATGVAVIGALQRHGPVVWVAIALAWAGFAVVEIALIAGALRE